MRVLSPTHRRTRQSSLGRHTDAPASWPGRRSLHARDEPPADAATRGQSSPDRGLGRGRRPREHATPSLPLTPRCGDTSRSPHAPRLARPNDLTGDAPTGQTPGVRAVPVAGLEVVVEVSRERRDLDLQRAGEGRGRQHFSRIVCCRRSTWLFEVGRPGRMRRWRALARRAPGVNSAGAKLRSVV